MAEKTKKLSDKLREVLDALVDAVESFLTPPPEPVPIRGAGPRIPNRRRR
jgi:hypothetical protein